MATDPVPAPPPNCPRCPRLSALRDDLRHEYPHWHNAPVPSFGDLDAGLLVIGLAPGRAGANRTGRPFTGDAAGKVLYPALIRHGFAVGTYAEKSDDGLRLTNCRISNAVRCLPPGNKPVGAEVNACRSYLKAEIEAMPSLKVILALGRVAHESTVKALRYRQATVLFSHGVFHDLLTLTLADSYHCSRYNLNTGRLTETMFNQVLTDISRRFFF